MKKNIVLFFLWFLFNVSAIAHAHADSSLFFTNDELQQIALQVQQQPSIIPDHNLHLGAILYYGPQQWSVWIQGERWTPETNHADIKITNVTADTVQLSLTSPTGQKATEINLKPHQHFNPITGIIGEDSGGINSLSVINTKN